MPDEPSAAKRLLIRPAFGAIGLFLFLVGCSMFFFRGTLEVSDEQLMAFTTVSIAEEFSLIFDREILGQRFTGYGVGMPAAGLPMYFLEKVLRGTRILEEEGITLIPLTSSFLFAAIGVFLGFFLDGERRWGLLAIACLASPFFFTSLLFYSELLASLGFLSLVAGLYRSTGDRASGWALAAVAGGAAVALLARFAMGPLLFIAVVWGWRLGAHRRVLVAAVAGVAVGVIGTMLQNWGLRGSPFATGYAGQSFTTPLMTGIYGLLFSPERGLLVFYPAGIVALLCWQFLRGRERAVLLLALACTIFSVVFHGRFWTWHGGWTTGPRFLLPCIVLMMIPVAALLGRRGELPWPYRLALNVALIWTGMLSFVYASHSAFAWWNQLWGFHGVENQWLFLPQLSLWQAWLEGFPLAPAKPEFGVNTRVVITGFALATTILSLYPLLLPYRGFLGTDPPVKNALKIDGIDRTLIIGLLLFGGVFGLHEMAGPRGWQARDLTGADRGTKRFLILNGDSGEYSTVLDFPLHGEVEFVLRADALYRIQVDEQLVMEKMERDAQHLSRFRVNLTPGIHTINVRVMPKDALAPPVFQLYWTWGGGGTYLAPAGGEYTSPRPLNSAEGFFSLIWRRKFIIAGFALALVLLLRMLPGRVEA